MNRRKIALIELGRSHAECLYSQILFLKERDCEVDLIYNDFLDNEVQFFENVDGKIPIDFRQSKWNGISKARKLLIEESYPFIVFNSIQEKHARLLLTTLFFKKMKYFGTLHRISKLETSFQFKYIARKAAGIYLLNDYLKPQASQIGYPSHKTGSFYPVFFPEYPIINISKGADELWVTIPGNVEFKRRDYEQLLSQLSREKLDKNVKLFFLGRSAHREKEREYFLKVIDSLNLSDQVITWESRVPNEEFYGVLQKSDIILPLIHKSHPSIQLYKNQISGSFNLAFGFRKHLMLPENIFNYEDFRNNVIRYEENQLIFVINTLAREGLSKIEHLEKFSFQNQVQKYWELMS